MLNKSIKKYFSSTLLKNGTIINSDRMFKGDVLLTGKHISRVFDLENPNSKEIDVPENTIVVDINGKYLIPGGIDTHTHMELPFMGEVAVDDFHSGTKAAVSGGTTGIIDFILPENGSLLKGYENWRKKSDGRTNTNYAYHCIISEWNQNVKKEMNELVKLGVQSFKIFLAYKGALMMDEEKMVDILETSKSIGSIVLVHAENGNLVHEGQQKMLKLGITGPEGHYLSRPDIFEALATHSAITCAEFTNSPLYIVHLMSKKSSREVQNAITRGVPLFAETLATSIGIDGRNLWNKNWEIAAGNVMSPPINPNPSVKDYLLRQLHTGNIHTVGSDNCTFCTNQKILGKNDFTKIPNGCCGIEDRLAILWTRGVKKGLISPLEFVKVSSTNASQIFNMYPRKGIIQEGADADVVVWNGDDERVISKETHHQVVDFNVFEGMVVNGTAEKTYVNGNLVFDNRKGFSNLNKGEYISRKPFGFAYNRVFEIDRVKNPLNFKVDRSNSNSQSSTDMNVVHPDFEEIRILREKVSELTKKVNDLQGNKKI